MLINKLLLKLHEKPIIVHTIDNFIKLNVIDYIIVAVPNDFLDYTKELISKYYNTNKSYCRWRYKIREYL